MGRSRWSVDIGNYSYAVAFFALAEFAEGIAKGEGGSRFPKFPDFSGFNEVTIGDYLEATLAFQFVNIGSIEFRLLQEPARFLDRICAAAGRFSTKPDNFRPYRPEDFSPDLVKELNRTDLALVFNKAVTRVKTAIESRR